MSKHSNPDETNALNAEVTRLRGELEKALDARIAGCDNCKQSQLKVEALRVDVAQLMARNLTLQNVKPPPPALERSTRRSQLPAPEDVKRMRAEFEKDFERVAAECTTKEQRDELRQAVAISVPEIERILTFLKARTYREAVGGTPGFAPTSMALTQAGIRK